MSSVSSVAYFGMFEVCSGVVVDCLLVVRVVVCVVVFIVLFVICGSL